MLTITNEKVIKYYEENPHLDINTMNLIFVDMMKSLTDNVTNKLDNSQNSYMIKQLTEKMEGFVSMMETRYTEQKQTIHDIQERLSNLSETISSMIFKQLERVQEGLRETIKSNNGDSESKIIDYVSNFNQGIIENEILKK